VWSLSEVIPRHYYNINHNRKSCWRIVKLTIAFSTPSSIASSLPLRSHRQPPPTQTSQRSKFANYGDVGADIHDWVIFLSCLRMIVIVSLLSVQTRILLLTLHSRCDFKYQYEFQIALSHFSYSWMLWAFLSTYVQLSDPEGQNSWELNYCNNESFLSEIN